MALPPCVEMAGPPLFYKVLGAACTAGAEKAMTAQARLQIDIFMGWAMSRGSGYTNWAGWNSRGLRRMKQALKK